MPATLHYSQNLAPFGWYPDPAGSNMLRWWDGTRWTDRLEHPRPEIQPACGYGVDSSVSRRLDY